MAIGTPNNTLKTRIQLKSDTKENWDQASNFIPLEGELIIYTTTATPPTCYLKVGDGTTTVTNLPFVDSVTINGQELGLIKVANYNQLPKTGNTDKLYIDLATNNIYYYDSNKTPSYILLSTFKYQRHIVSQITGWTHNNPTKAELDNHVLKITNGSFPVLNYTDWYADQITSGGIQEA